MIHELIKYPHNIVCCNQNDYHKLVYGNQLDLPFISYMIGSFIRHIVYNSQC